MRALPLGQETTDFITKYDHVYLVEMNFDGQMCSLVRLHVPEQASQVRSIAHCDGLPLTARFGTEAIREKER